VPGGEPLWRVPRQPRKNSSQKRCRLRACLTGGSRKRPRRIAGQSVACGSMTNTGVFGENIRWVIRGSRLLNTRFGGTRAGTNLERVFFHAPKRLPSKFVASPIAETGFRDGSPANTARVGTASRVTSRTGTLSYIRPCVAAPESATRQCPHRFPA
jgi:hypothetical protein